MAAEVTSMIQQRRQTYAELDSLLAKVKVGDWLEVEANYSTRLIIRHACVRLEVLVVLQM